MGKKYQVVFISNPEIGTLVPTVEFAHRLIHRDPRFCATVLVITLPDRPIVTSYIQSRASTSSASVGEKDTAVNFLHLPIVDLSPSDTSQSTLGSISLLMEKHKPHVKQAIEKLGLPGSGSESDSVRVAGLFIDLFSTPMIDVARELGIPCYLYVTSPASCLGFMLHLPTLETQLAAEFDRSDTGLIVPKHPATELKLPSFANPLPPSVLPTVVLKRQQGYYWFLHHARRFRETNGIVVNTCKELEPYAFDSVSTDGCPPVYPIGPVLDLAGPSEWHPDRAQQYRVMKWLDNQPPSSVVFLCFGSMGSLNASQVREIAGGVERTGFRFLWSIREPPKGKLNLPGEYNNLGEILPDGFLDRTTETGLVCGWVPQVTVLAHKAVGGFISHCGWNSVLESLWHGVPIATWPVYAEQQMNAFQLVVELGLAVEIRLDYREEAGDLVLAGELEEAIHNLMKGNDGIRRKVKEMSDKCRLAVTENGSSDVALLSLTEKLAAEV